MTPRLGRAVAAGLLAATATVTLPAPAFGADTYRDRQWHLASLDIAAAQKISQGEGVIVAVIDTGIEQNHPDLAGNVLPGLDVVAGGSRDGWGDKNGHGTGMAGLIAGHGHGSGNRDGVLGIAPKAKILPIRMDTGSGFGGGDAMALGIDEAVKRGAKVISISVNSTGTEPAEAVKRALAAGVVIVASSGNRPATSIMGPPALLPGVIAVGATDRDGKVADLSVRDEALVLTAPGIDIVTSSRIDKAKGTQYSLSRGTSDSTAIVAGVVALVMSKYPQLTPAQVLDQLTSTAVDKGAPGRDREYGFGIVDPVKALTQAPRTAAPSLSAVPLPTGPAETALPDTGGGDGGSPIGVIGLAVGAIIVAAGGVVLAMRRRARR